MMCGLARNVSRHGKPFDSAHGDTHATTIRVVTVKFTRVVRLSGVEALRIRL